MLFGMFDLRPQSSSIVTIAVPLKVQCSEFLSLIRRAKDDDTKIIDWVVHRVKQTNSK